MQFNFSLLEPVLLTKGTTVEIFKRSGKGVWETFEGGGIFGTFQLIRTKQLCSLPSCIHGRIPPIKASAKLLYPSGQLMSSLLLVTVLDTEDTKRPDLSAFLQLSLMETHTAARDNEERPHGGLSKP